MIDWDPQKFEVGGEPAWKHLRGKRRKYEKRVKWFERITYTLLFGYIIYYIVQGSIGGSWWSWSQFWDIAIPVAIIIPFFYAHEWKGKVKAYARGEAIAKGYAALLEDEDD